MAVKQLYRGATDKVTFNVIDCDTGGNLDVTTLIVSVQLRYQNSLKMLSNGFSTDASLPGTINKTDPANGLVEIQLTTADSLTAELGVLDMHIMVADAAGTSKQKSVVEEVLTVEDHAIK